MSLTLLPKLVSVFVLGFLSLSQCSAIPSSVFGLETIDLAQQSLCGVQINGVAYDLQGLSGVQMDGADAAEQWDFYLSLCGIANATKECMAEGAMVCEVNRQNPNNQTFAAAYPPLLEDFIWTVLSNGIQLTAYGSSSNCSNKQERQTNIQVLCDPNVLQPPTTFDSAVVLNSECSYTIQIRHALGCPLGYQPSKDYYNEALGFGITLAVLGGIVLIALLVIGYRRWKRQGGHDNLDNGYKRTRNSPPKHRNGNTSDVHV